MFDAMLLLAQAKGEQPPFWVTFMPIILIVGVFYFLIIMPARRRERQQREMLMNNLKKNDEVITHAGIIGIVANVKKEDGEVTIKVDESSNVKMRILISSIANIRTPKGEQTTESNDAHDKIQVKK